LSWDYKKEGGCREGRLQPSGVSPFLAIPFYLLHLLRFTGLLRDSSRALENRRRLLRRRMGMKGFSSFAPQLSSKGGNLAVAWVVTNRHRRIRRNQVSDFAHQTDGLPTPVDGVIRGVPS